jgi:site-specific DNA-methyltransferase (adenine-specific)
MIKNIDCFDYMKTVSDGEFDLVITSPPYNMNLRVNSGGEGYRSRNNKAEEFATKYSGFSDDLPMTEYEEFLIKTIRECCRVSNLVFLNVQSITGNKPALARAIGANADRLKEVIIWDKKSAQPAMKDKTLNSMFEFIYVFGDNPISRQFSHANHARGEESNVWHMCREKSAVDGHKATYPLALPMRVLNNYSMPGYSVLDPFAGTGTTGVACNEFQLDFIGCEIDPAYCAAGNERIKSGNICLPW